MRKLIGGIVFSSLLLGGCGLPDKLPFGKDSQVQAESWDDGEDPFTNEDCVVSDKVFSSIFEQNTNTPVAKSKWAEDGKEFAQIETRSDDGAKETLQLTCRAEELSKEAGQMAPVYLFDEEAKQYKATWRKESVEYTYQFAAKNANDTVEIENFKSHVNTLVQQHPAVLAVTKQDVPDSRKEEKAESTTNNGDGEDINTKENSTSPANKTGLSSDEINELVNQQVTNLQGDDIGTIDLAGDGFPEVFTIVNSAENIGSGFLLNSLVTFYEYNGEQWTSIIQHHFDNITSNDLGRVKMIEGEGEQIVIGGTSDGSTPFLDFLIIGNPTGKETKILFDSLEEQMVYGHPGMEIIDNTIEVWAHNEFDEYWDGVSEKDIYYWDGSKIAFRTVPR